MSALLGRTVRLFLAEGTASGVITAEIMNWTGHVLTGSRSRLPTLLERSELGRTGIYLLTGPDPEDSGTPQVYIGESDNVGKRLAQHGKDEDKDFWERICVVTSKDQNITKAHARYLEARVINIANASDNANVVNRTRPPIPQLPEADESDMEFFIAQLKLILPVLGFDFLRQPESVAQADSKAGAIPTECSTSPLFRLNSKKHGVEAQAHECDGEFVVLRDSTAVAGWKGKASHSYAKRHMQLVKSGKLVTGKGEALRFAENVVFRSPSAASSVILGRSDNGRTSWKIGDSDISYGEWQSQQLDSIDLDYDREAME